MGKNINKKISDDEIKKWHLKKLTTLGPILAVIGAILLLSGIFTNQSLLANLSADSLIIIGIVLYFYGKSIK